MSEVEITIKVDGKQRVYLVRMVDGVYALVETILSAILKYND